MQSLRSALDHIRENYTPISKTSTFRETGQITPEEFVQAGDFLVYKFPSWSWADATTPKQRVSYLPEGKQYLVTRGVPCRRRLDENFAGGAGLDADIVVGDGEEFLRGAAAGDHADEGWLRTGGESESRSSARGASAGGDVRTVNDAGEMGDPVADDDDIPDMEDEDDDEEAIIRDAKSDTNKTPLRTYTLYIAYSPYYRTPRLYLSGYQSLSAGSPATPLPPTAMMEDIVADYKDKTVTLEDFSFITPVIKTASVHPCRHASVMKVLLDRADNALKLRLEKMAKGQSVSAQGMEGLLVDQQQAQQQPQQRQDESSAATTATTTTKETVAGDEWEDVTEDAKPDQNAIRVDQYLVVFLKFMASVTPGIEHDYTMGV